MSRTAGARLTAASTALACLAVAGLGATGAALAAPFPTPAAQAAKAAKACPPPAGTPAAKPSPKPSPAPSPTGKTAKGAAEDPCGGGDHADDAHAAAELLKAARELEAAEQDLKTARASLEVARKDLEKAQDVAAEAQADLTAARLAEQRAAQELARVRGSIVAHRTDLGRLARSAYQSNGAMGELALVLSSETPVQLADRLAFMHSIASVGNAVISDLGEARANLESSQARLAAARTAKEAVAERATAALLDKAAKEQAASMAELQVGAVVAARRAAFLAAKKAEEEDRRRYQVLVVQSGRLGERIVELSAELAESARPPKGTGRFVRPGTGDVTSPYGPRFHPILHYVKVHTGVDFAKADGLAYAADRGTVIITEFNVAYGNMTVIDHGTIGGLHVATLYGHQAAFAVKVGDRVRKGQPIGVIGSTGYSTGPHLHFEVRIDGTPLDPSPFLEKAPLPPAITLPPSTVATTPAGT